MRGSARTLSPTRSGWVLPQGEGTEKGGFIPFLPTSSFLSYSTLCWTPTFITHKRARGETVSWSQMALPPAFWVLIKAAGSWAVGSPGTTKAPRIGVEVEGTEYTAPARSAAALPTPKKTRVGVGVNVTLHLFLTLIPEVQGCHVPSLPSWLLHLLNHYEVTIMA